MTESNDNDNTVETVDVDVTERSGKTLPVNGRILHVVHDRKFWNDLKLVLLIFCKM